MREKIETKKTRALTLLTAVALGFAASPIGAEERHLEAHEHGVSSLRIAQEGEQVELVLEAPGSDIVGFEHAPETADGKAAVAAALKLLSNPERLFAFPEAAGCAVLDKEAEFETGEDHAEFHVHWHVSCTNISALDALDIVFFNAFERAEEIEAEIVGDGGQGSFELDHGATVLSFGNLFN